VPSAARSSCGSCTGSRRAPPGPVLSRPELGPGRLRARGSATPCATAASGPAGSGWSRSRTLPRRRAPPARGTRPRPARRLAPGAGRTRRTCGPRQLLGEGGSGHPSTRGGLCLRGRAESLLVTRHGECTRAPGPQAAVRTWARGCGRPGCAEGAARDTARGLHDCQGEPSTPALLQCTPPFRTTRASPGVTVKGRNGRPLNKQPLAEKPPASRSPHWVEGPCFWASAEGRARGRALEEETF
jgi:hypothetical protein